MLLHFGGNDVITSVDEDDTALNLVFPQFLYLVMIFTMLGYNVQVEQATSQGRMDVTIRTKDYVYILELKLDKSAEEALQQIKDNGYARPFQADPRQVFLIGVNFSSGTRTVEKWMVEEG